MKLESYIKSVSIAVLIVYSSISTGNDLENLAVKELLELSGAKKQYDQLIVVITTSMKDGFIQGFNKSVEGKNIDKELLAKRKEIVTSKFNQFVDDFEHFMHEEISWDVLVDEVYAPVYLKHLTVDEIQEISSFYKSKTGAKFSEISPFLIQDSSNKFNEIYGAQLNDFAIQAAKKRMGEAAHELKTLCGEKC